MRCAGFSVRRLFRAGRRSSALFVLSVALAACARRAAPGERAAVSKPDPSEAALVRLRAVDEARRASTDFAHLPPAGDLTGPDPFAVRVLPGARTAPLYVGLLRGRAAVVLLDASLHEIQRVDAPASPTGLAFGAHGEVFVSSELSGHIARYRVRADRLEPAGSIDLDGVLGARDIAVGPEGIVYVTDERGGRLIALELDDRKHELRVKRRVDAAVGLGPIRVLRAGRYVLVDCLLDHSIAIRRVDGEGIPAAENEATIHHDGPIWSFDAAPDGEGLIIAAGGVEDHPLDRSGGSFGYIDSFAYVYRMASGEAPQRLAQVNTSALGVITPKWISLERTIESKIVKQTELRISGYGGDRMAVLRWAGEVTGDPSFSRADPLPPGTTHAAALADGGLVFADPLLDAWISRDAAGVVTVVPAVETNPKPPRMLPESRVGEALFFTSLMAPWDKSDGELSRFTCETCHFEGYVDGRIHHTGRGDVHATTKPLRGLGNNRPHFSRALDPDLTAVAHNEFRVAGARSDHTPWFSARVTDFPWLTWVGVTEAELSPEDLRRSLMSFLFEFTHAPNTAVVARLEKAASTHERPAWSPDERAGAEVFRDRCERCHAARLASDVPGSRVPFEQWEGLVLAREGAIVWGRPGYEKTGVVPYVHEEGARVPSLRRLAKKRPYFTNGSAKDLASLLARARFGPDTFFHDAAPAGLEALSDRDRQTLLAFLDLL